MLAPTHILVIRFSAMGDVAMTVPVIKNTLQQHPQLQITVVSNAFYQPFFLGIERCNFYAANLKQQHKGVLGMYRLFKQLKATATFDAIADLHSVLRSSMLTSFFKLSGYTTATIDKGRTQKKLLTKQKNKQLIQLPTSFERYALVFKKLGIPTLLVTQNKVLPKAVLPDIVQPIFSAANKIIGIAPFAQHIQKMYPLIKMKLVVKALLQQGYTILLFGGGKYEADILQTWQNEFGSNVTNIAGKYSLQNELAIISNLQCMVSMDSANMHIASLYNVPVISIWGATHPYAGFCGWGQSPNNIISIDIYCRPCSVFGNKPCYRGDNACMNGIQPLQIVEKVVQYFPIN